MTDPLQLSVVDLETGELRSPGCQQCQELAARLAGKTGDYDALVCEYTKLLRHRDALLRDRDRERDLDPQRALIAEIFEYWQVRCGHPRSKFDAARFDLIKARLRMFTVDELKMAVDGAAVACYVDEHGKRHDRLGLVFQSAERVEDFANRYALWQRRHRVRGAARPVARTPQERGGLLDRVARTPLADPRGGRGSANATTGGGA